MVKIIIGAGGAGSVGALKPAGRKRPKRAPGPSMGRRKTAMDYHVAGRLRLARKTAGWSQVRLAAVLGLRFQTIQKREAGVDRVSAGALWATAVALGVDVDVGWFFEDVVATTAAEGGA